MARTTVEEVREIITTSLTDAQVEIWMGIANTLVTENVACGLSAAVLTEIERQITAHLIAQVPNSGAGAEPIISEKLDDASVTYADIWGKGFESSSYGKTALLLDSCGGLANMGKRTAKVIAVTSFEGKTYP